MTVQFRRHKFTVADYMRMGEVGVLGPEDRVELIEGEIVELSPIGSRRAACVRRLIRMFSRRLADRAVIDAQDPVELNRYSMPQPDFAVLRPSSDYYASAHPTPEDVLLLIEVADTTLRYDQKIKAPLYYRTGVREAWIIDLEHQRLLVFRGEKMQTLSSGETIAPLAFPDDALAVSEILGA